jgi:thioredoxin reductase (NADPH)
MPHAQTRETPDLFGAFPRLSDEQIRALEAEGERRRTSEGQVLFSEGDASYDFYVVLEGLVRTVSSSDPSDPIAVHGPGRFLGELSLLSGEAAFLSAVVEEAGEVLEVPADRLRALVARDTALGDVIMRAYFLRREFLIGLGAGLRIVGSRHSPDTQRLREFAARNRLPHRWIDLEEDSSAEQLLRGLGVSPEETPVVIWGRNVLRNPSNAELARQIGLRTESDPGKVYDLLVVGAGPAGLAASVYGASEGLDTMSLDGVATGGQAGTSPRIENYLGFPSGLSGSELAERATMQARKFGAQISVPATVTALEQRDGHFAATLDDGEEVRARAVVAATGCHYRRLNVARLPEFEGISVHYAATQVEGQQCVGDPVAVVGGGNSAGQAALFLVRHAATVRLIAREDDLGRDMSRYLADRIEREHRIEVLLHTEVRELIGDENRLDAIEVEDNQTRERGRLEARQVFVFIGTEPKTRWLGDLVALDDNGFVVTGPPANQSCFLETSCPGVFAVGDVRSGSIKRVASAVGEGSMAIRFVHAHLQGEREKAPVL